ncbi:MAG: thiamine phosphate synthase [Bacteroidota bacterium]
MSDLPRLLLIADGFASGRGTGPLAQTAATVRTRTAEAVAAGVRWVMLRDHAADDATFLRAAARLTERLRDVRPGVRLSVNTRTEAARRLRADLHVGTRGPSVAEAVRLGDGDSRLVGFSAHSAREIAEAARAGAAYATVSPLYRTATHPDTTPAGLALLRDATEAAPGVPVLALGGITPSRVAECHEAGAHGVAVLSGLLDAHRIARAVEQYLAALAR